MDNPIIEGFGKGKDLLYVGSKLSISGERTLPPLCRMTSCPTVATLHLA